MSSDSELLLSYARNRDERAYAELVRAHIDLVYSAAARRVGGDPHAAAEVTQDVFLAMARHAERLARHPVLNAWLHISTRNAAANLRRREQRRERQKQQVEAMRELETTAQLTQEWDNVRSLLDDTLDELSENDRRAIILRFFEGHSFVAIGAVLQIREDAARMRVTRALDTLRANLARRGIVSTASVLGGALSAHAVIAAPAGLAASVTATATAAATAGAGGLAAGLFHFMTTTKLSAAIVAVAIITGVGVVVSRQASRFETTPEVSTAPTAVSSSLSDRREVDLNTLIREANEKRGARVSSGTMEAEEKIATLQDLLEGLPEQSIPELKLATNGDWHAAVDGPLETTEDYRRALARIRSSAERRFAVLAHPAVRAYLDANNGHFPRSALDLIPYVNKDVDSAMLRRYRVAPAEEIPNVRMDGTTILTQEFLIDSEYDSHTVIGEGGFGSCSSRVSRAARDLEALMPAIRAFRTDHGVAHKELSQVSPYVVSTEQKAALQRLINAAQASKRQ